MIETECQQLIVRAAKEAGGEALKLNNRFLVGVADLLVKIPGCHPEWLEAKLSKFSVKTLAHGHTWELDVTKKQKDFLRDWDRAGMRTGVASFVMPVGGNVGSLCLGIWSYDQMVARNWTVTSDAHHALGGKDERMETICSIIRNGQIL